MNVCCVAAVAKDSGFLSLGVLKFVVCLYKGSLLRCCLMCVVPSLYNVECCVLYPCCLGVFGMFCCYVGKKALLQCVCNY